MRLLKLTVLSISLLLNSLILYAQENNIYVNHDPSFTLVLPHGWKFIPRDIDKNELMEHVGTNDPNFLKKYIEIDMIGDNDVIILHKAKQYGPMRGSLVIQSLSSKAMTNIVDPKWRSQFELFFKALHPMETVKAEEVILNSANIYKITAENEQQLLSIFFVNIQSVARAFQFKCRRKDENCVSSINKIMQSIQF